MFRIEYLGLLGALLTLGGCASWQESLKTSDSILGVITPYRVEVVQGNVVTKEQMAAVRPGMSRAQVRNILGSPLLTDVFHENRWDYIFTIKRQGTEPQRRSVVLTFDGDLLKTIDAPDLPGEQDFVASISPVRVSKNEPKLELTEEQRKALPVPPKPEATPTAPEPTGATRTYPPLEAAK
ncbi:MAG: outer membrane protein assembly factor BamE [Aquincola tertiaricarbonis]|uniref:outer membrane protein assembly factor BamE n=1 Tax=Aquincola TaxID=391952 RepID=UPI000614FB8B|nr:MULTISPECIES: outer membrane protein assembly factor BamE [Aquincola]MCR5866568.1 outer membrane protein assembly factor BamE [Aquincola sp. J276]